MLVSGHHDSESLLLTWRYVPNWFWKTSLVCDITVRSLFLQLRWLMVVEWWMGCNITGSGRWNHVFINWNDVLSMQIDLTLDWRPCIWSLCMCGIHVHHPWYQCQWQKLMMLQIRWNPMRSYWPFWKIAPRVLFEVFVDQRKKNK